MSRCGLSSLRDSEEDNVFDGSGSEADDSVEEDEKYYALVRQREADYDDIEQLNGAVIAKGCKIARCDAKLIRLERFLSNFYESWKDTHREPQAWHCNYSSVMDV